MNDTDEVERIALTASIQLVVVGPEAPLVAGLADRLRASGVAVFGPSAAGAKLEGSKIFCKRFFDRHGIRTAPFRCCATLDEAADAIEDITAHGTGIVVKADGLTAGKGVYVCSNAEQAHQAVHELMEAARFGDAGRAIVIEQRLHGRELSIMAMTDGRRFEVLPQSEDHKAIFDGDRGPNTGGMGAVSPCHWVSASTITRIRDEVLTPTLRGWDVDGIDYRGLLYAGLMIDDNGTPWMLEYNCRFGDPETQVLMMRAQSDLAQWMYGAACGHLPHDSMKWDSRSAVCVVLASAGYPGESRRGVAISGLHAIAEYDDVVVFHAGTERREGQWQSNGGRVLGVTALGIDRKQARARAYHAVSTIVFDGMQFRRDISGRGLVNECADIESNPGESA